MANNNQPTKWRAIDKRTGQWVEGWYVEHHWVERAGEAVYAEAHPCIFNDELGERGKGACLAPLPQRVYPHRQCNQTTN